MATTLLLSLEVTESSDRTKLYLKDTSSVWGGTYINKSNVTALNFTFKHYNSTTDVITEDTSDWITTDKVINKTGVSYDVNDDIIIEISASSVNSSWEIFPDGIYYVKYSINTDSSLTPATNNTTYIKEFCLYQDTQNYRDELFKNIAQNITCKLEEEYSLWYSIVFNSKLDGFKAAIGNWNLTEIRNGLAYLQLLQTKYPTSNDIRII